MPTLNGIETTRAPAARATAAVSSVEPSSTTSDVDAGQRADLAHDLRDGVLLVERRDDGQAVAVPGDGVRESGMATRPSRNGRPSLAGGPAATMRSPFGEC